MPLAKYNTDEERREAHRIAALKYARKHIAEIIASNKKRYHENRDAINARRREIYAAKKAQQKL
jgi:hypothetical protein